jgi:hypothetical protein
MSTFPRWLKVTLALTAILMLAGLAWYYRAQRQRRLQEVNTNLETIIQQKLNWIDQWPTFRKNQAAQVMANRLYVSSAARWMKIPPTPEEIEVVLASFREESIRPKSIKSLQTLPSTLAMPSPSTAKLLCLQLSKSTMFAARRPWRLSLTSFRS